MGSLHLPKAASPAAAAGQVITCRAAVVWAAKGPIELEEIEVEPPQADEVRIKITHTSLCHTDVFFWENEGAFPRILGHEAAGIVESVGEGVKGLEAGDHVVPVFTGECEECRQCKSKKTNLCAKLKVSGGRCVMRADARTRFYITLTKRELKQKQKQSKEEETEEEEEMVRVPISHFLNVSSFAEYTVVDAGCVAKISPLAPLSRACLFACGVPTGVGAAWNNAKVEKDSSVVIFGLGAVGLAVAEGARTAGASRIIGVDVNPKKFELAKQFGVTEFLNPQDYDKPIQKVVQELTFGGVDYSFECVGNADIMLNAFECTREGWGKTVLVGIEMRRDKLLCMHPMQLFDGRSIRGSTFGEFRRSDIPGLVDKYMNKALQVEPLVTHELPFERINEAFKLLIEGKSVRCVMEMGHHAHDHAAGA